MLIPQRPSVRSIPASSWTSICKDILAEGQITMIGSTAMRVTHRDIGDEAVTDRIPA